MPDTGAAAGQQIEMAVRLRRYGAPLSYANAAAFEADDWALSWRMAQTTQSFIYTIAPSPVAADAALGWHVIVLTLVDGEGDLLLRKPSGIGWTHLPLYWRIRAEQTDTDDVYNAIQQSVGVATSADLSTTLDFSVTDDDSLVRTFTVLNALLALFGYDSTDLTDDPAALTLEGSLRASDNSAGIPDAWMAVTVVTATDGEDPVLRISWADYPSAVALIQEGLDFSATDPTDDPAVSPVAYLWQVRAVGVKSWSVTGVNTGAKTFTIAGDQRRWFAPGGSLRKTATGAAAYTVASVSYSAGSTTITVTATPGSAVVDGLIEVDIKFTLGHGTLTTDPRQIRP